MRVKLNPASFNDITGKILNAAIEVHRILGAGLLESTYLGPLQYELGARKMRYSTQRTLPVIYKGMTLDTVYRIDLIVEDTVVVEVKSVAATLPVHQSQLLTYMRLAHVPVGLLINFNVPRLMDGVKRMLNPSAGRES
jgi:GxxExxY protein